MSVYRPTTQGNGTQTAADIVDFDEAVDARLGEYPNKPGPRPHDIGLLIDKAAAGVMKGATWAQMLVALTGEYNPLAYVPPNISVDITDGLSHPLSDFFPTVDAAKAVFPHITALIQELAWACIQSAINAARSGSAGFYVGKKIVLPAGTYLINETLVVNGYRSLVFEGAGMASTILRWNGFVDNTPMLRVINSRECAFRDFGIFGSATFPLLCGIAQAQTAASGTWAVAHNRYDNITIDGQNGTGCFTGFAVGARLGPGVAPLDQNNGFTLWTNCTTSNFRDQGWYLTGSKSYNNEMRQCTINSGTYGVFNLGYASFVWEGGGVYNTVDAAFYTVNLSNNAHTAIRGVIIESCGRLVYVQGSLGGTLEVKGVHYSGNSVVSDGVFVYCGTMGHVNVSDNIFIDSHATRRLRANWFTNVASVARGSTFTWERNILFQNVSILGGAPQQDASFFTTNYPTLWRDNQIKEVQSSNAVRWARPIPTLTVNSTTPSINLGDEFFVTNTAATVITILNDSTMGKTVRLFFTNSNTTVQANASMKLAGGVNFVATADDVLTLYDNGTAWVEIGRSVN